MLTREQVIAALRADAPAVVLGILILGVSLGAFWLYFVRRKPRDPAILWFALFALLYGVRELLEADTVRLAGGISDRAWAHTASLITYAIIIPSLSFIREVIPAWKRPLTLMIRGQVVFSCAGLAGDLCSAVPIA